MAHMAHTTFAVGTDGWFAGPTPVPPNLRWSGKAHDPACWKGRLNPSLEERYCDQQRALHPVSSFPKLGALPPFHLHAFPLQYPPSNMEYEMAKQKKKLKLTAATADKHVLYEASVQSTEHCLDFTRRVFRRKRKRSMKIMREDFCGTAILSCDWARSGREHVAYGIDLDQPTLDWSRNHHIQQLPEDAAKRVHLIKDDVLTAKTPKADAILAFNFSFYIFKTRDELCEYFKAAWSNLAKDGILFLDIFGGPDSMASAKDKRKIKGETTPEGVPIQTFTYVWDQTKYNHISHELLCHIHFRFKDGTRIEKAFTYDWRLWTVPELQEILTEAGFATSEVYMQGWDDKADDTDNIFRRRKFYDDMDAWIGYIAAMK